MRFLILALALSACREETYVEPEVDPIEEPTPLPPGDYIEEHGKSGCGLYQGYVPVLCQPYQDRGDPPEVENRLIIVENPAPV